MKSSLLYKSLKIFNTLLLFSLILGSEPLLDSFVKPGGYRAQNLKLVMDTCAQVKIKHEQKILRDKQRILEALERVAIGLSEEDKDELAQLIYKESHEQVVDPRLIIAMIKTESEFRKEARSRAGAHGLMQVRFPTAKEVAGEMGLQLEGRKSLYNPQLNIKMGTYYLGKMVKRFDDLELALTAYNMGPTELRRRMVAKNRVSKRYSKKVLSIYKSL